MAVSMFSLSKLSCCFVLFLLVEKVRSCSCSSVVIRIRSDSTGSSSNRDLIAPAVVAIERITITTIIIRAAVCRVTCDVCGTKQLDWIGLD